MASGHVDFECPFCHKRTIKAFHRPSYLEHRTSRISAGSKTKYFRVPESYEIMSGCSNCGKSKKEIVDFLEGKESLSHEERIERLKKRGLPLIIGEKYD
jgi:hypothetical protein